MPPALEAELSEIPFAAYSPSQAPSSSPYPQPSSISREGSTGFTPRQLSTQPTSVSPIDSEDQETSRQVKRRRVEVQLHISGSTEPRSSCANWKPPLPVVQEGHAIAELRDVWDAQDHSGEDHIIWKLNNFCVYRPIGTGRHAGEFAPLQALTIQRGATNDLWFDGTLSVGNEKRYVERVPFQELTVEGYGDLNVVSLRGKICIRSTYASRYPSQSVWYELGSPDSQYARYHEPYLWIAHLGKFFVDFLIKIKAVTLNHFRSRFITFLTTHYSSPDFASWHKEYGSNDFRNAVAANYDYLWKECCGLSHEDDLASLLEHPIWDELRKQAISEYPTKFQNTVVTPFVYDCFKHMPFVSQMQPCQSSHNRDVEEARKHRRNDMSLTPLSCPDIARPERPFIKKAAQLICKGDVVCVAAENESKLSKWKKSISPYWYAYVQGVRTRKNGKCKLDLLWLYEPKDTTLGDGHYPFQNELFMSDNCSCGADAVDAEVVLGVVDVSWFATIPSMTSYFVRQKFRTVEEIGAYDFVTLSQSDFRCYCNDTQSDMDDVLQKYHVGNTVLLRLEEVSGETKELLEPAEICAISKPTNTVTLRGFRRTGNRPNQIAPIDQRYSVNASQVVRPCYIRQYRTLEDVPAPFNRGGAGDFFFIVADISAELRPFSIPAEAIQNGRRLRGMGIFCGGGNFDRGLEEGGAVDFRYAVDWAKNAIHTYRANLLQPESHQLFLGSVNDYLALAMQGSRDHRVAKVGGVELLAAGSPCPGFSSLQPDKQSEQSLRNCSLVAAVVSMVDFYTPEYMVLENVTGLASQPKDRPDLNVFSQVLCCLVSMGYQVQQYLMDPTNYGSCQSRARIFIIATAPNCTPLSEPPVTHSDSSSRIRAIGKASNGLPFGQRKNPVAPFLPISIREATEDLPDIADSHVQTCIPYPDHRTVSHEDSRARNLIAQIPRWPHGLGFMQTYNLLHDPAHMRTPLGRTQIEGYAWQNKHRCAANSRSWSRLFPNDKIGCITTAVRPHDGFLGRILHWDQPRVATVMEARRGQGFLDNEVITGTPREQWQIIGNSVDRKVALALGLSFGKAWLQTLRLRTERMQSTITAAETSQTLTEASNNTQQFQQTTLTKTYTHTFSQTRTSNMLRRMSSIPKHDPGPAATPGSTTVTEQHEWKSIQLGPTKPQFDDDLAVTVGATDRLPDLPAAATMLDVSTGLGIDDERLADTHSSRVPVINTPSIAAYRDSHTWKLGPSHQKQRSVAGPHPTARRHGSAKSTRNVLDLPRSGARIQTALTLMEQGIAKSNETQARCTQHAEHQQVRPAKRVRHNGSYEATARTSIEKPDLAYLASLQAATRPSERSSLQPADSVSDTSDCIVVSSGRPPLSVSSLDSKASSSGTGSPAKSRLSSVFGKDPNKPRPEVQRVLQAAADKVRLREQVGRSRTTRRSGAEDLVVPTDWAGLVEHSIAPTVKD